MLLSEFTELINNFREIEFTFSDKSYLASCFWIKPLFRKGYVEYWLTPTIDNASYLHKFETIDELLNSKIEGQKLKDILNEIEITCIY